MSHHQKSSLFVIHSALILLCFTSLVAAQPKIRIALDDIPGIDMINLQAAVQDAEAKGLDIELIFLQSEDIAVQAVLDGQAEIGMGTPYGLIENQQANLRMFFQLNTLRFFPVVNTSVYQNWQDLDGQDMFTHGQGSGTEAIMNLLAKQNGIQYKHMYYVPGSGVRARAMLQGKINATIVDSRRRNRLLEKGKGRFAVLPVPEFHASDEALYANQEFIENYPQAIQILVESLLKTWRSINQTPEIALSYWQEGNLYPRNPRDPNLEAEILEYYQEMVGFGAFPENGGGEQAVQADFEFYSFAGTLSAKPENLKLEDYWDMRPLTQALEKLAH